MTGPDPTAALWRAVDRITKPTRQLVGRDPIDDELTEWSHQLTPAGYLAVTTRWAVIPSLWEQSTTALSTGSEAGGGSKPLRERAPVDVDLMEIRGLIRDTTRHELAKHGVKGRTRTPPARWPDQDPPTGTVAEFEPYRELRALASAVIRDEPDQLWWWAYRCDQWGRLLASYLQAVEHKAKPMRLRNSRCPKCSAAQMTIEGEGGMSVVPALVIDFTPEGYARAAECLACGAAFWRGAELEELARVLEAQARDTPKSSDTGLTA